jgi:hypothetical protein
MLHILNQPSYYCTSTVWKTTINIYHIG